MGASIAASGMPLHLQRETSNPHLSLFEPYRELPATHEDQLTRAAMIVLRLVPLAREALLHAIGESSQSRLPDCQVDMQVSSIVDLAEEDAIDEEVRRERLVSVLLAPDTENYPLSETVSETNRGQRFDGVLRFDPELVVLLESKVSRSWARTDSQRVATLNLGGVSFANARTIVLRWHDLLESWWRLVELGVLAPVEQAIVQDMLNYASHDFNHLLPFGNLRRVGADPTRRRWRLRSLLHEATGIDPERSGLVHVRLDTAIGARSLQRVALGIADNTLSVHIWPGELKRNAAHFYGGGRAARLTSLLRPWNARWKVDPQPLLGFRNAPIRKRMYLTCKVDTATYLRRWQGRDWSKVGAHHRDTIRTELWPWLLGRGYAAVEDEDRLDPFLRYLGRRLAHLRPCVHITHSWSLEEAIELDDKGELSEEIRRCLDTVLGLLEEPPLRRTNSRRRAAKPAALSAA